MSDPQIARLPARATASAQGSSTQGSIVIDPEHLLKTYPGPAVMLDPRGSIIAANAHADDLCAAIERNALGHLVESLMTPAADSTPMVDSVILPAPFGGATLDLTVLPYDRRDDAVGGLLVLARNVTLDRSLRNALVESRQRYKDLVECSADFAWETGADGSFVFVSPRGALGYSAEQLIGSQPEERVIDGQRPPEQSPFQSATAVADVALWSRTAEGEPARLSVSALPLFDKTGRFAGARGICRDVTNEYRQNEALERARFRDRALYTIVREIRNQIDLDHVLSTAAKAIVDALGARTCWLFRDGGLGPAATGAVYPADSAPLDESVTALIDKMVSGQHSESVVESGGAILATAPYGQDTNAVLVVTRDTDGDGWSAEERILLLAVANQLGIAIEQAMSRAELQRLSRTDPLTGLLNRRAFLDEVGRRLHLDRRTKRFGSLFYFDINNFKLVNDKFGHARGDQAIVEVAHLISAAIRASDVFARVGGDEFVLWLEEADASGARIKAESLLAEAEKIAEAFADAPEPLGLAIGIAVFDPSEDETLQSLIKRADAAMFAAKAPRKGSGYAFATPYGSKDVG